MQTNVMMVVLCFSPFGEPLYDVLNVSILIGQLIASPLWLKHTKENSVCLLNFPPTSLSHLSLFLKFGRILQIFSTSGLLTPPTATCRFL